MNMNNPFDLDTICAQMAAEKVAMAIKQFCCCGSDILRVDAAIFRDLALTRQIGIGAHKDVTEVTFEEFQTAKDLVRAVLPWIDLNSDPNTENYIPYLRGLARCFSKAKDFYNNKLNDGDSEQRAILHEAEFLKDFINDICQISGDEYIELRSQIGQDEEDLLDQYPEGYATPGYEHYYYESKRVEGVPDLSKPPKPDAFPKCLSKSDKLNALMDLLEAAGMPAPVNGLPDNLDGGFGMGVVQGAPPADAKVVTIDNIDDIAELFPSEVLDVIKKAIANGAKVSYSDMPLSELKEMNQGVPPKLKGDILNSFDEENKVSKNPPPKNENPNPPKKTPRFDYFKDKDKPHGCN